MSDLSAPLAETPGRLSFWRAALVVARRDFLAILFGRTFFLFLLGPLFPAIVATMAGGIGAQTQSVAMSADIGLAMQAEDTGAMLAAREELARQVGPAIPRMVVLERLDPGERFDGVELLESGEGRFAAVVTGTLAAPELAATQGALDRWRGVVALVAARAVEGREGRTLTLPDVATQVVATSGATQNTGRLRTAQGGQLVLFLLIMLLATMVLSNLAEEKGNKIIEILAAAIPMDAVFLGKLFAMLGISAVGIAVWGSTGALILAAGDFSLASFTSPGVGWPLFFALGAVYFAMGYLLLGAIFLAVGSMAATVRDVQTLSMPVTMAQVMVFFLASMAVTQHGQWTEYLAMAFPLSSPFAMLARAATDEALWPHAVAIGWQLLCVALFIRFGAQLFRRKVMKSGPRGAAKKSRREKRARQTV